MTGRGSLLRSWRHCWRVESAFSWHWDTAVTWTRAPSRREVGQEVRQEVGQEVVQVGAHQTHSLVTVTQSLLSV